MKLWKLILVTLGIAALVTLYCHAAVKVTVVTHRTEQVDLERGTTNYVWQYEASFSEPNRPLPGEYRSSLDSGSESNLTPNIEAQIASDVARFFRLRVEEVEVLP